MITMTMEVVDNDNGSGGDNENSSDLSENKKIRMHLSVTYLHKLHHRHYNRLVKPQIINSHIKPKQNKIVDEFTF